MCEEILLALTSGMRFLQSCSQSVVASKIINNYHFLIVWTCTSQLFVILLHKIIIIYSNCSGWHHILIIIKLPQYCWNSVKWSISAAFSNKLNSYGCNDWNIPTSWEWGMAWLLSCIIRHVVSFICGPVWWTFKLQTSSIMCYGSSDVLKGIF